MIRQDWSTLKKLMFLKAAAGGGSAAVERYANGNPVVFGTDMAKPLKEMLINLLPVQSGSGDPSPQNIRPIVAWDGVKVFGGGKNLLDAHALATAPYGSFDGFGFKHKLDLQLTPNTYYTLSSSSTGALNVLYFNGTNSGQVGVNKSNPRTKYSGSTGILSILLYDREDIADYENELIDLQLEVGQTATAYEPYVPITETDISFPSPVYGGQHEVVSGKLMNGWNKKTVAEIRPEKKADHIFQCFFNDRKYGQGVFSIISDTYKTITAVASTGGTIENLYAQYGDGIYINSGSGTFYICDSRYTDVDEFKTAMADTVIVYELATPQEITLTPEQITVIKGNNTIWSDANDAINLTYLVSGKYAEDHPVGGLGSGLGSGLLGAGTEPEEPIEDPAEEPGE